MVRYDSVGEKNEEYRVIKDFWMSRLLLIKDEKFKDFDKYDKLHIGKTFEMLIDINTIKEKLSEWYNEVRTIHSHSLQERLL